MSFKDNTRNEGKGTGSRTNLRGGVWVFPVMEMFGMMTPNIWLLDCSSQFSSEGLAPQGQSFRALPDFNFPEIQSERVTESKVGQFAPTSVITSVWSPRRALGCSWQVTEVLRYFPVWQGEERPALPAHLLKRDRGRKKSPCY